MLLNQKMNDFAAEIAKPTPTPGGGSVAAATGMLAASLIEMVISLTIKKENQHNAYLRNQMPVVWSVRAEFESLVDKDAEAFDSVMLAYRLPKNTNEEISARTEAIALAYKQATLVPLATANAALNLLSIARHSLGKTNPNAITDLGVAVWNADACLQGALLNIAINLAEVKDGEFSVKIAKEVADIKRQAEYYKGEFNNILYGQELFLMLD